MRDSHELRCCGWSEYLQAVGRSSSSALTTISHSSCDSVFNTQCLRPPIYFSSRALKTDGYGLRTDTKNRRGFRNRQALNFAKKKGLAEDGEKLKS
jgi:hypothetical protein